MDLRQLFEQGVAAHQAGRLDQAEKLYRQILGADAASFPALHMLGFLKAQQGRFDEAIPLLNKAVKQNPADADSPGPLWSCALMAAQRSGEALEAYERLLEMQPGHFEAHYNRGVILSQMLKHGEALAALDQALAVRRPMRSERISTAAWCWASLQRLREAQDSYDWVLAREPGYMPALANRIMVMLALCDWDRIAANLARECGDAGAATELPGLQRRQGLCNCACACARRRQPAARAGAIAERRDATPMTASGWRYFRRFPRSCRGGAARAPDRAPRPRALSGDRHLHRARRQQRDPRPPGKRLRPLSRLRRTEQRCDRAAPAARWKSTSPSIWAAIPASPRLHIFSHRFAPVQASWLGFPGTTGARFIDYLIADAVVAPPQDQPFYSETLVQLPDTYFPTDPARGSSAQHPPAPMKACPRCLRCRQATALYSAPSTMPGRSRGPSSTSGCGFWRKFPAACCG